MNRKNTVALSDFELTLNHVSVMCNTLSKESE